MKKKENAVSVVAGLSQRTRELMSASSDTVAAAAIAEAQKELSEKRKNEEKEKTILALKSADDALKNAVEYLKSIRAKEKEALKNVKALDAAIAQFSKDGNVTNLMAVVYGKKRSVVTYLKSSASVFPESTDHIVSDLLSGIYKE